jgi:predicted N-acyltransferase
VSQGDYTVRVHGAARDLPEGWDALVGLGTPFLESAWLRILEDAGCATERTGWLPQHLTVWRGTRLVGGAPLYVKAHSLGEFVFDQGWATAARRAGIAYYPKLLVGVPFTPVTGARLLARVDERAAVVAVIASALEDLCRRESFSSVHVNFCLPDEAVALGARGWLRRTAYQYHWRNAGFGSFDDYLASLRSKRRNQVRRERRALAEQGIEIVVHRGPEIPAALPARLFALYRSTIERLPWGQEYLNARFFALAREHFAERLCWIVARRAGEVIAGTFNVEKGDTLYGRWWGADAEIRHLHFNVCYYAAVEHCIAHGLQRFEPGAGGEFKQLRGFEATATESMHLLADPRLAAAVGDFLRRERRAVAGEIRWLNERSALRRKQDDSE